MELDLLYSAVTLFNTTLFNILAGVIRQENGIRGTDIWKKEMTPPCLQVAFVCMNSPSESMKTHWTNTGLSKTVGYKTTYGNQCYFYITAGNVWTLTLKRAARASLGPKW